MNGYGDWLLVIDNVDKGTVGFLRGLLPRRNLRGDILFTTRNKDVAEAMVNITDRMHHMLELKTPDSKDAAVLLLKEAGIDANNTTSSITNKAQDLVKCVGYLPLAISQAALFMSESHKTIEDMLDLYRSKSKINVSLPSSYNRLSLVLTGNSYQKLLSWENGLSLYEEGSVATTFASRFDQLERLFPDTSLLLKILSFFDTESLPVNIIIEGAREWKSVRFSSSRRSLEHGIESPKSNTCNKIKQHFRHWRPYRRNHDRGADKDESKDISIVPHMVESLLALILSPIQFNKAIQQLQDISLVTHLRQATTSSLRMHDLIKFMVQEMTMDVDTQSTLFVFAVEIVCGAFRLVKEPTSPKSWPQCETFVPHFESLTMWGDARKVNNPELSWANLEIAGYFRSRERCVDAERLYNQMLASKEKDSGPDHPDVLGVLHGLAYVLERQGRYGEAENLYRRALLCNEKLHTGNDLERLKAVQGLAYVYEKQGRYAEAEELGEKVLAGREKQLGAHHPDTLQVMYTLALVYGQRAMYDKAEKLFSRSLAGFEKALGIHHRETLRTLNALANLYDRQCRYEEAVGLYMRALAGMEIQLGANHPQTLRTVCGLANLYVRIGLYCEADKLYGRVLEASKKHLQISHPDTLRALHGLATLHTQLGTYCEAEKYYEQAIAGRERLLGDSHPDTLRSVHGLAIIYSSQDRYSKAERLYRRVLEGKIKQLGLDHSETLQTIRNLVSVVEKQGKYEEAKSILVSSSAQA